MVKGEVTTCARCGLPQRPSCDGRGTELGGPCAFSRCENERQIEVESIPLRKAKGFLNWKEVQGTAKSWKGRRYFVFYIGIDGNDHLIVRPVKGGDKLLSKTKATFEEIEVEERF